MPIEPRIVDGSATIRQQSPQFPGRILVVDDDSDVCRFVVTILTADGYEAIQTQSGEDAIRVCELDSSIRLLLADVVMPHVGGRQWLQRIGHLNPNIKVILMSGYPNLSGILGGIASRSDKQRPEPHFIKKPFSPVSLRKLVHEVLDPHPEAANTSTE